MKEEQEFGVCRCKMCKHLYTCVSSLSPKGRWICCNCGYKFSDEYYRKWKVREMTFSNNKVILKVGSEVPEYFGVV